MKCPQCEKQMNVCRIGKETIHECQLCRGIWFNQGELEATSGKAMSEFGWMGMDIWKNKAEFKVRTTPIFCPKCTSMTLITLHDCCSETEINLCNQCKGIWMNADQFCNVIDRMTEEMDQQSVPDYIRESIHQIKEMIANPKSILTEWHDLKSLLKLLHYRILAEHPEIERLVSGLQKSIPT